MVSALLFNMNATATTKNEGMKMKFLSAEVRGLTLDELRIRAVTFRKYATVGGMPGYEIALNIILAEIERRENLQLQYQEARENGYYC